MNSRFFCGRMYERRKKTGFKGNQYTEELVDKLSTSTLNSGSAATLDAELAEIDENLIRAELTVLERGEHLKRRKEIYEAKYPEAKATTGRELANKRWHASEKNSPASFAEATAAKLGVSPRTVQQALLSVKTVRGISLARRPPSPPGGWPCFNGFFCRLLFGLRKRPKSGRKQQG